MILVRGHACFLLATVITSQCWASSHGLDLGQQPALFEYRGGSEHLHVNSCYLQGKATGDVQPDLHRCTRSPFHPRRHQLRPKLLWIYKGLAETT